MDQLEAMGAAAFDIGVKRIDGTMLLREGWGAKQVLKSLLWLRRENLNRGHIYVRPAGIARPQPDRRPQGRCARADEGGRLRTSRRGRNLAGEFAGLAEARRDAR